jgi:hypothetical protein
MFVQDFQNLKLTAATFIISIGAVMMPARGETPQDTNNGIGDAAKNDSMKTVIVTGVRTDQNVLPTVDNFPDAFGLNIPVTQTPRAVSVITRQELTDADVQSARDFSKLSADLYTPFVNGSPSSPYIRGQVADIFVNGMRVGFSSEGVGVPIDFNSVESVDIVKGPAPALYGASQNVGGFIDLNTKKPFFDRFRGEVSATFGMYDQYRWTVDAGGPIIPDKLAFRVSYSGEESGSFYRSVINQSQALYAALTWTPSPNYELDVLNEFNEIHYQMNRGINRPTQALIDNGTYITGTQMFRNTGTSLTASTFPQNGGVVVPTGSTTINRSDVIVNPSDSSYAKTDLLQIIQRLDINDALQILNTTFFYYLDRRQYGALRYSAVVEPSYALEDRLEFHLNADLPIGPRDSHSQTTASSDGKNSKQVVLTEPKNYSIGNMLNFGLDFRYQHVLSATDIAHSYNNLYDLTQNPGLIGSPLTRSFGGIKPVIAIPGSNGYFGTPGGTYVLTKDTVINGSVVKKGTTIGGSNETNDTWAYDSAIFLEDRISFTKTLALFLGARGDLLHVDFVDPISPPGFSAVKSNTTQGLINLNANLTYQPVDWLTSYFSYNYSTSTTDGQGGGYSIGSNNRFANPDFRNASDLYEGGFKFNLLDKKLFIAMAGFRQTRSIPQEAAPTLPEVVWGGEFELTYQPTKNFYATISYSYLDPILHNQAPTQKTGNVFDTFVKPVGTANGSPNLSSFTYPVGDYVQPGVPHHLFNARLNYQFDNGLGASLGVMVTSPINVDFGGRIKIPTQYELDGAIFYVQKSYELRLDILDITDQKNWSTVSTSNGADLIYPELPFRIEGTVRIKF